jgi:hypothetical protein
MDHHPTRRAVLIGGAVLALGASAGGLLHTRSAAGDPAGTTSATGDGVALATVRQGPLAAELDQTGTLTYAAQRDGTGYPVVNQAAGLYTKLPATGQVVARGQVLYWIDDSPVLLLNGSRPFYRDLYRGRDGWDVRILNDNLEELGYDTSGSSEFTWSTKAALEDLQDARGADETGVLRLGQAVVLPGPLRISAVTARLGTRAVPGAPVATAATTTRQVVVQLDASQQGGVKVGDKAQITLPDNRVTPGRVSRIGTVAAATDPNSDVTLPVYLTLDKPKEAGTLDAAPVRVQITTAGVKNALSVPVTALVGRAGGGYAVERVTADGRREPVPVELGLFDDAAGQVQVTGALAAGDRVVVPAS